MQDFRFPSFPRRRESSQPLKNLDTRFRGYDEFTSLAKVLRWNTCSGLNPAFSELGGLP